ncbi:MAG: alpha-N-acetylglucosaminidase C-terminal domain-containing protein [[Clostridium] fimetarium]|nr:alpha-N-acetylglucosaminidase C-terminal domain-containing protein [[Clostridium] fimetarium]
MPRWRLGHQIAMAEGCASEEYERDLYRWNLLKLVTTWGNREASERGKLHDYAHREWQGLLGEYYLPRWRHWFAEAGAALRRSVAAGTPFEEPEIDWYDFEEPFSLTDRRFDPEPSSRPVDAVRRALESLGR